MLTRFIKSTNGGYASKDGVFKESYLKVLIKRGESISVVNEDGYDITLETLVRLLGNPGKVCYDLISLLDTEVIEDCIRAGTVTDYKQRRSN